MKKLALSMFVIAMVFALVACGGEEPGNPRDEQIDRSSAFVKTELTVWGMTCNSCANRISRAVSALDGVAHVSVDLRAELVTVEHEPELDAQTIKDSITAAGYNIP